MKTTTLKVLVYGVAGWLLISWMVEGQGVEAQPTPQTRCVEMGELREVLKKQFGEVPAAFGLQTNGNLLQIYSSERTGTWTVVTTSPDGTSCIVAAGKGWEDLPPLSNDPIA